MDEIYKGEKGCCHVPAGIEGLPSMEKLIKDIKEKSQILIDNYKVQDISIYKNEKDEVYIEVRV